MLKPNTSVRSSLPEIKNKPTVEIQVNKNAPIRLKTNHIKASMRSADNLK